MSDNRPASPSIPPVTRELIADLLGRILAEHWLRRQGRKGASHLGYTEQTHQNSNVGQTPRPVE